MNQTTPPTPEVKIETILAGCTSEDTAFVVQDYPYGYTLRTQIRYWLETNPKHGTRFVSQTKNPKTGKWNAPKRSTYDPVKVLVLLENGHVETRTLGNYADEAQIAAFEAQFAEVFGDYEKSAIRFLKAARHAAKYITYTIRPETDERPAQTRAEAREIMHTALLAGYRDLRAEEQNQ